MPVKRRGRSEPVAKSFHVVQISGTAGRELLRSLAQITGGVRPLHHTGTDCKMTTTKVGDKKVRDFDCADTDEHKPDKEKK